MTNPGCVSEDIIYDIFGTGLSQNNDEGTFESYQQSPAVNGKFYGAMFSPPLSQKTGRKDSMA